MTHLHISDLFQVQKNYFATGKTRDVSFRLEQLKRLQEAIKRYEVRFSHALKQDLGKSAEESFISEIAPALGEVRTAIKKLHSWTRKKRVRTPLSLFKTSSFVTYEPLGQVLVITPWNYPVSLAFGRIASAIAAGNTVILKPSELTPTVNEVMERMLGQYFDQGHVSIAMPTEGLNESLATLAFDMIHFTGSEATGRKIYEQAAQNLTPVVLELGGKSPAVVHNDADLALAARRLVWGKALNAGQTCVAPDYLLLHEKIKTTFLRHVREELKTMFGPVVRNSPHYARIISDAHFERLEAMLAEGEIVAGGESDKAVRFIGPTFLSEVPEDALCMKEEIFGPILPIFTYKTLEEAAEFINQFPPPLAVYCFSTNSEKYSVIEENTVSGAFVLNDAVTQVANPNLPFGGVGSSGFGRSNGFAGFAAMSNQRAVVKGSNMIDIPMRFAPWTSWKMKALRKLLG